MKKVGILTLNGNTNYGNRLQNYALQEVIKKLNCRVDCIWFIDSYIKMIKNSMKRFLIFNNKYNRYRKFYNFSKSNLNIKYYLKKQINNKYDYFIVGSDQVWNYDFKSFDTNTMFLKFSDYEKNISYSASFGVDTIPNEYIDIYKKGLNNIKYISVRENQGKKIVEFITKRNDCEVLLDPTMLLSRDEWDEISKKPKKLKTKKYILNYFLGNLSKDKKEEIEKIAREENCDIINLLDKKSPFYECGPSEFLYLEKNAYLICTDSFHSSVFAFLYNRPFIVFDREDDLVKMNSRIETLISKFNLKNRKFNGKITKQNLEWDYTEAYKILEKERKKSNIFLKKSLSVK